MTQANFSARPLTAGRLDQRYWVDPKIMPDVLRAVDRGFNTMIIADPGSGATSLMNKIAATLEDAGGDVGRVAGGQATDARELLILIIRALEAPDLVSGDAVDAGEALAHLGELASERPKAIVLVDDPPAQPGHAVFGRMRDELWTLEIHWLVACSSSQAGDLLTPPADAFFEAVFQIGPWGDQEIIEMLRKRDPENELDEALRTKIATRSSGNPARALSLARQTLLREEEERWDSLKDDPVAKIEDQLGEPAARLYAELLRLGASSPSDKSLLTRMSWSAPRSYQVFRQLEQAGFVTAHAEHSGRAGRPRKIYETVGE